MFHCNILQCMIRKAYRMYEIFFAQSMNPIFLWIRVSTPRNPHCGCTPQFTRFHHMSSSIIRWNMLFFFWLLSYINRRSFSIPGNSWLSRFFLDLGGAENRCEILGRRMSGSSVGWFSDILDIFFGVFQRISTKTMENHGKNHGKNNGNNHGKPWEKPW